jgi:hypothetical protein
MPIGAFRIYAITWVATTDAATLLCAPQQVMRIHVVKQILNFDYEPGIQIPSAPENAPPVPYEINTIRFITNKT